VREKPRHRRVRPTCSFRSTGHPLIRRSPFEAPSIGDRIPSERKLQAPRSATDSSGKNAQSKWQATAAALETALGESETTRLVWKPATTTELDLDGAQKLFRLIEALEDDDDVQHVTANFEVSDAVMEAL
jgi:hypothetical protein